MNSSASTSTSTSTSASGRILQVPRNNKEYGTKEYWEHRFATEESFEWLVSYPQVRHQLEPLFLRYCTVTEGACTEPPATIDKSQVRILMIGCGNAPFSIHLYDDGYTNIVNIDYSCVVIQNMQQLHQMTRPHMQWRVMDMTQMDDLQNDSFDIVLDKAAMDAIMTHEHDVWNPNLHVIHNVYRMCSHITRILQPCGTYIQISLTQPHFRIKYLLHVHDDDDHNAATGGASGTTATSKATHSTTTIKNTGSTHTSDDHTTTTHDIVNYCPQFRWTVHSEIAGQHKPNTKEDGVGGTGTSGGGGGGFGHYVYIMTKSGPFG
jgi:EEF1A lysine methyltransferase 4